MVSITRRDFSTPDWISSERLYLDKDGNVVGAKDPAKLTLLVAEGGALPFATAVKYGLVKVESGATVSVTDALATDPALAVTEETSEPSAEAEAETDSDAAEAAEPKATTKAKAKKK